MNNELILLEARVRTAEMLRRAEESRRATQAVPRNGRPDAVVRLAGETDAPAVERLSQLEGRRPTPGPLLVAERDGQILAAVPLEGGDPVADPFRPTADLVELLGRALAELRGQNGRRRWSGWAALRRRFVV